LHSDYTISASKPNAILKKETDIFQMPMNKVMNEGRNAFEGKYEIRKKEAIAFSFLNKKMLGFI